jgi:subtilisin family serine protease
VVATPALIAGVVLAIPEAHADPAPLSGKQVEYNVLLNEGANVASAQGAITAAGGTVTRANAAVGLLTVRAPEQGFTDRIKAAPAVTAATRVKPIGQAPQSRTGPAAPRDPVEKENRTGGANGSTALAPAPSARAADPGLDPLDYELWGLKSVRADLARTKQAGDRRVRVGVIDTGIDGSHPDIAPNFDAALSRNFTQDIPYDETGALIDGPCEFRGCVDPADHDDNGHGTHVAGTIAAAVNGLGVSGVAPNVTLVNIRAGQDFGYFFLQPTVDALTYAGDIGIDVVNMSFYVDPWLFNCENNPADSPEAQAQQRLINTAMRRALRYANNHDVTLIAALGNEHEDMATPQPDESSPDYPTGAAYPRTIDAPTCYSMPSEGPNVLNVSAYGPSRAKADYSNYGQHVTVSAPGGWFRDYFGTPQFRTNENLILSAYPQNVGIAEGNIDPATGDITPAGVALGVQKDCLGTVCGYYQFLQGTSMASPHAVGVAALIVSQFGTKSKDGLTMSPAQVKRVLTNTAFDIPCPTPRTVDYLDEGRDASYTATCVGTPAFNGFYGAGSVDAYAAVTRGRPGAA